VPVPALHAADQADLRQHALGGDANRLGDPLGQVPLY
jgi:hypothetical protein